MLSDFLMSKGFFRQRQRRERRAQRCEAMRSDRSFCPSRRHPLHLGSILMMSVWFKELDFGPKNQNIWNIWNLEHMCLIKKLVWNFVKHVVHSFWTHQTELAKDPLLTLGTNVASTRAVHSAHCALRGARRARISGVVRSVFKVWDLLIMAQSSVNLPKLPTKSRGNHHMVSANGGIMFFKEPQKQFNESTQQFPGSCSAGSQIGVKLPDPGKTRLWRRDRPMDTPRIWGPFSGGKPNHARYHVPVKICGTKKTANCSLVNHRFPECNDHFKDFEGYNTQAQAHIHKKNVYIKRYSTFRSSAPCQKLPIYTWDHMSKTLHSWGFPIAMLPCLITGGGIESILQWQLLQGGLKAVCQYVSVQCFFPIIPQFRKPTINSRHQLKGPQLWSIYPTAPKMVGTSLAPKRKPSTPHHPKAWNCPSHPCTGALLRPCARGVFGAVVGWWQGRVPHALYSGVISRAVGADA